MNPWRGRAILALIFLLVPALFIVGILLPSRKRMEALRAEQDRIAGEMAELPRYSPLSEAERAVLSDPAQPWRRRIPLVASDRDRVAHYNQVVTQLQQALMQAQAPPLAIRSEWDPIRSSFTLAGRLGTAGEAPPLGQTTARGHLAAWVLEARFNGGVDRLFRAIGAAREPLPLLEPVGFHWETTPEGRIQAVLFRNLIFVPDEAPAR